MLPTPLTSDRFPASYLDKPKSASPTPIDENDVLEDSSFSPDYIADSDNKNGEQLHLQKNAALTADSFQSPVATQRDLEYHSGGENKAAALPLDEVYHRSGGADGRVLATTPEGGGEDAVFPPRPGEGEAFSPSPPTGEKNNDRSQQEQLVLHQQQHPGHSVIENKEYDPNSSSYEDGRINLQNSSTTGGLLGSFRTSNANEKVDVDNSTRKIVHAQEEEIAELRTRILKLETALKISEEENKQKADILSAAASVADLSQHESGSGRSEESKPEVFPTSLRNQHSAGTSKLTSKAGAQAQQQHPSASSRGLHQPEGEAVGPERQDGEDHVLSSRTSGRGSKNSDKPIYGNIAESNRIEMRSSELEVEDNYNKNTDGASPKQKYQEIEQFSFTYRVSWLIGLLLFQSSGSFILSNFSTLLQKHPSIVYFSTMLVGAGGNAGGQSVVYVVRRLATGKKIRNWDLAKTAVGLALCVMLVAVMRFTVQDYLLSWPNPPTAFVLSLSAFVIVFVGAVLGALLPQLFLHLKIDPAHASATIQVVMDIVSLLLVCFIFYALLGMEESVTGSLGGETGSAAGSSVAPGQVLYNREHEHSDYGKSKSWLTGGAGTETGSVIAEIKEEKKLENLLHKGRRHSHDGHHHGHHHSHHHHHHTSDEDSSNSFLNLVEQQKVHDDDVQERAAAVVKDLAAKSSSTTSATLLQETQRSMPGHREEDTHDEGSRTQLVWKWADSIPPVAPV
ncbi:unnamed protein product [Amoebophrya sp. A120]|nr:unnamed protein product [Amoebophrya sp. A120]|eukprot:GSA120T00014275001.1